MYILSPKRLVAPFFSRFQRWVCRASQVMMDDGSSVEDAVSEIAQSGGSGSGGSGSGAPRVITLWGEGEQGTNSDGTLRYTLTFGGEETYDDSDNYVSQEDIDYIFAHKGEIVIIANAWDAAFGIGYIEPESVSEDKVYLNCTVIGVISGLRSNMNGNLSFSIIIDKGTHTFTIVVLSVNSGGGTSL